MPNRWEWTARAAVGVASALVVVAPAAWVVFTPQGQTDVLSQRVATLERSVDRSEASLGAISEVDRRVTTLEQAHRTEVEAAKESRKDVADLRRWVGQRLRELSGVLSDLRVSLASLLRSGLHSGSRPSQPTTYEPP